MKCHTRIQGWNKNQQTISIQSIYDWIKTIRLSFLLFQLLISSNKMKVHSFQWNQPTYVTKFDLYPIHKNIWKKHHTMIQSKQSNFENEILSDRINDNPSSNYSRRDILSMNSALAMALSLQYTKPKPSNAIQDLPASISNTNRNDLSYNNIIPFSSVRQQKIVTLSNGLKVLLVNDKRASQSTAAILVDGPGQFKDPPNLPGLAHLMEHIVLSYQYKTLNANSETIFLKKQKEKDIEDWLNDNGGTSNAFTEYTQTCFHFNCPNEVLGKALERFALLFIEMNVIETCKNTQILAREIRRVDSELDLESINAQEEYITKSFVNPEHPYSKFSRGSLTTLEKIPNQDNIDVPSHLKQFFHDYYLPNNSVLVVVSNQQDLSTIQRFATPFSVTLSQKKIENIKEVTNTIPNNPFEKNDFLPGLFLRGNRYKHVILYRKNENSLPTANEKLVVQWVLNEDYRGPNQNNAFEIAFVLNQILGRRGPGSLYRFLRKRKWIQNNASTLPPQISVPINISGFQILKLELSLTLEGFLNRSRIVAAIYSSIETLRNPGTGLFVIPRELMSQYATIAKVFGYILTPRPPDAVELAIDSFNYGIDTVQGGKWYRFPSNEAIGGLGLNRMRRAVSSALSNMSDPDNALIIATAGDKAIAMTRTAGQNDSLPLPSSSKWNREKLSGAKLYLEDMLQFRSQFEQSILTNIISREELLRPVYNPFLPAFIRPPRIIDNAIVPFKTKKSSKSSLSKQTNDDNQMNVERWQVLIPKQIKMPLPRVPPEPTSRCAFILQLLSSRPARATAQQAAHAELWRLSFEDRAKDLIELGAPGGLACEFRFNKYGLRISFLGLSQTLPSYARRLMQLLVRHQVYLLKGKKTLPESVVTMAILNANRARDLSPARKYIVLDTLKKSTSFDAAFEGANFLQSCTGGVSYSQGDFTSSETGDLLYDLRDILQNSLGNQQHDITAIPSVEDISDAPKWLPRNASPCYVSGVFLMSDVCGRIPR